MYRVDISVPVAAPQRIPGNQRGSAFIVRVHYFPAELEVPVRHAIEALIGPAARPD